MKGVVSSSMDFAPAENLTDPVTPFALLLPGFIRNGPEEIGSRYRCWDQAEDRIHRTPQLAPRHCVWFCQHYIKSAGRLSRESASTHCYDARGWWRTWHRHLSITTQIEGLYQMSAKRSCRSLAKQFSAVEAWIDPNLLAVSRSGTRSYTKHENAIFLHRAD